MKKILLIVLTLFLFTSCGVPLVVETCVEPTNDIGFFEGVFHGFIILFTFVGSLIDPEITIYSVANNGIPYNLGFAFGCGSLGPVISFLRNGNDRN